MSFLVYPMRATFLPLSYPPYFDYLNILCWGVENIKFLKLTIQSVNIYVGNFKKECVVYSTDADREVGSFQCWDGNLLLGPATIHYLWPQDVSLFLAFHFPFGVTMNGTMFFFPPVFYASRMVSLTLKFLSLRNVVFHPRSHVVPEPIRPQPEQQSCWCLKLRLHT